MGGTLPVQDVERQGLRVGEAPIKIIMAVGAIAAVGLLVRAIGRARAAGDLDASTAVTLALGWLVTLPIDVVVLSGGVVRRLGAWRELVPVLPGWYAPAVYLCQALVIAVALGLSLRRFLSERRLLTLHTAGLLALVLWAVAWLAAGLQGGRVVSLSGATLLACLVAATVLPRGRGAAVGAGVFGVTLAIASAVLVVFRYDIAFVPCRHVCVLGSALTGLFGNENLLATALVAALPFAYLGFRGRTRFWLTAYVAAMAFTTGSRGAMVTVVIVLVTLAVVRPRLDGAGRAPARTAVAGLVLIGALLASVYVLVHDWESSRVSLDDRPELWRVAADYRRESPIFGYGPDRWETLYAETGEIARTAQHSTHNQWVDVVFTAGWAGAALLVAMMVASVWSAGVARAAVLIVLATVFLIGIGERAWFIGRADFTSFSLVALILLGPTAPRRGPRYHGIPPSQRAGAFEIESHAVVIAH